MNQKGNRQPESRLDMWFSKLLRTLLLCCSAGGGAAFIYALVEKEPRMVLETLQKFGPETFLGLIALLMLDRSIKNGISILRESTQAQQRLADAVQEIAHKDDREREEQRRLMNYIGAQQERILDVFQQHMDKEKETKSKGASA